MATRALICGPTANGLVAVRVGVDGDPESVGLLLRENYGTSDAVEELLELGDLWKLGATPKLCRNIGGREFPIVEPVQDGCVGDSLVRAVNDSPVPVLDIDWAYAFEDGLWECMPGPCGALRWEGVTIGAAVDMVQQEQDDAEAERLMAGEGDDGLPSPVPH